MDGLLTVDDVADYTRLSTKTLYSYASQKKVPHIKLGSRLLFDQVQLKSGSEVMQSPTRVVQA